MDIGKELIDEKIFEKIAISMKIFFPCLKCFFAREKSSWGLLSYLHPYALGSRFTFLDNAAFYHASQFTLSNPFHAKPCIKEEKFITVNF